jgi:hypothetical protein
MALSSLSTRQEVLDAYADNSAYEENESVAQAKAFASACRLLLSPRFSVKRTVHGSRGEEVELDLTVIQKQLDDARHWIAANAPAANGSGIIHPDFTDYRS